MTGVTYNKNESATQKVDFGALGAHLGGGKFILEAIMGISEKIRIKLIYHAIYIRNAHHVFLGTTHPFIGALRPEISPNYIIYIIRRTLKLVCRRGQV